MKITKLDRRRAIWRFPEFQDDLEQYKKLKSRGQRVKFSIESSVKWKDEFEAIARAEEQAEIWKRIKPRRGPRKPKRQDEKKPKQEKPPLTRFTERGNVEAVISITNEPYVFIRHVNFYENGKQVEYKTLPGESLYLKIKLKGKRMDDLIEECREVMHEYHAFLNPLKGEGKNRKTDIAEKDIWGIYDLYLKTGQNMDETTRQIFGLKGNRSNRDWDEKYRKQTETAVKNAIAIIQAVREELSLNPLPFIRFH